MNSFSISELQQFSGIKAHTIRIWEQRYNALKPSRSEGNTRHYNTQQLRRLLNIVSLMDGEYKVSELCVMSDDRLHALLEARLAQAKEEIQPYAYYITQVIAGALGFDEAQFEKVFSNAILRFGLTDTYAHVLHPVLIRLGMMWMTDTLRPAHEHFITGLIRQKILAAIDGLPLPKPSKSCWVLFLPENELHETGLLFANFLVRQAGRKVIYLGANVPFDSLKPVVSETKATHLLSFLIRSNDQEDDRAFFSNLNKQFPDQKILVACDSSRAAALKKLKNIKTLHDVSDLDKELK